MKDRYKGLSSEEVKASLSQHGSNALIKEKKKSFLKRYFENLSDPIIKILFCALVLQFIVSFGHVNYFELGGILVAIIISTTVSTVSEHRSECAFDKISREAENCIASVIREGKMQRIPISDLVVGDIIYLSSGEMIPADGEMIDGRIGVDQSALNGEGIEVTKAPGKDRSWDLSSTSKLFRGTMINSGSGFMRVMRVGQSTYYGMVAKDVQSETRVSPLKLRLGKLASQISKIGYIAAGVVGITYLFNTIVLANQFDSNRIINFINDTPTLISTLLSALTLMITMTVVAAPEGLPMMITVVLSANMKRMIADNILVKKLVGIETAGSMNILFTDKTGTLTVGRPECEKFIYSFGCSDNLSSLKNAGAVYEALVQSAKYNTDIVEMGKDTGGGNTTERAIYDFFRDCNCAMQKVKEKTSFSSERKFSSATLENGKTLIKGAAEVIIAASKYALTKNGDMIVFDKDAIMAEYYDSVNRGERVVGVAISEKGLKDLCFVALITMRDKIRPGVVDSVRRVKSAGIQVVMITGDGGETAKRIAVECGIFSQRDGHISLSSDDLRKMSDAEIKAILAKLRVVYRALPGDKTRLVRLSQELDLVVGMTGDGINDSPSLKLADVGFAMGSGTDIAKSAADIVILDDSFLAISKTVLYGRTIFKSIRKFITFQLTMNLAACGVSLLGQFIGIETPITIIQMLWVNIIMDTLGGLAFAGEPPMEYFMKEKTKSRSEHILSKEMINQIACTGLYTLAVCILFLTSPVIRIMFGGVHPTEKFYTAFYVLFIFSGLFNCFLARCSRLWLFSNISQNKAFILIMFLIAAIQICMVYFGGSVFRCVPLQPHELSFVILMASSLVPFEMVRRLIYKLK